MTNPLKICVGDTVKVGKEKKERKYTVQMYYPLVISPYIVSLWLPTLARAPAYNLQVNLMPL